MERYKEQLIAKIKGKLIAENAIDLSDKEIDRCLCGCVDKRLVDVAKQNRDSLK